MFTEETTSWEREMVIREFIETAHLGFVVTLRKGVGVIEVYPDSPCIDLIVYGLEKQLRGNHGCARMTFIDFMYYWHERLFKQVKRKPRTHN